MTLFYCILILTCQLTVFVYYAFNPPKENPLVSKSYFPTEKHLALMNLTAAIALFSLNRLIKAFVYQAIGHQLP